MTKKERTLMLTPLVTLLIVLACAEAESVGECLADATLRGREASTSLQLKLCALRQEYGQGEAVELAVVLTGTEVPVSLVNHPEYYRFTVMNAEGDTVHAIPIFSATLHYGERAALTLPARGALSFVVDLACLRPMLAVPDSLFPACWSEYALPEGDYRVSVRREVTKLEDLAPPSGRDTLKLVSSDVVVRVR